MSNNITKKAAIIGGGVIGGAWAARFVLMGWDVKLYDPSSGAQNINLEVLERARKSLPALYDRSLPREGILSFCDSIQETVYDAHYIQESVPERLDLKHKVLSDIQASCLPEAVLASSTSGFKPSQLQEKTKRPEQILVCHPFNPVYLMPLVEVVPSIKTDIKISKKAQSILKELGMKTLHINKEIDAHIADRLLEAVWREGLWLVHDDIATTEQIDNAIRYGFGLRWAQMGLFETYRTAGGKTGMAHFISQFGPALKWPWSKLVDVPELNEALVNKIAQQSEMQSGQISLDALLDQRDKNLIALMRALKGENWGAGALLNEHEARLEPCEPFLIERQIPPTFTDYNEHMNDACYAEIFSRATDIFLDKVGGGTAYTKSGYSYFTVQMNISYLDECHEGDKVYVSGKLIKAERSKLVLALELLRGSNKPHTNKPCARAEITLVHVDLKTRKSCPPPEAIRAKLAEFRFG